MTNAKACWESVLLLPQASPPQPYSVAVTSPLAEKRGKYFPFLFFCLFETLNGSTKNARPRLAGPQPPGKDAASFPRNSPRNNKCNQCVSEWYTEWFLCVSLPLNNSRNTSVFYFICLRMTTHQLFLKGKFILMETLHECVYVCVFVCIHVVFVVIHCS